MNTPTKDKGNFKKRRALNINSHIMHKIRSQKTISTHLVIDLIDSMDRHNQTMENRYKKLANKSNLELQSLRKSTRMLEDELKECKKQLSDQQVSPITTLENMGYVVSQDDDVYAIALIKDDGMVYVHHITGHMLSIPDIVTRVVCIINGLIMGVK